MRIISGSQSGRTFASPQDSITHPMSEKIRGALFNILGDIQNLSLLDPFSGSGALSFEAISRGAKQATAIDVDSAAYRRIVANAKQLDISKKQIKIIHANCFTWSTNNPGLRYDIVIVDPPYEKKHLNYRHVFKMVDHVKVGGIFVASLPPKDQMAEYYANQLEILQELVRKDYGDAQLVFYRRIS